MEDETQAITPKKVNPVGRAVYGARFTKFDRIGEIKDLIAAFKEYYYAEKIKDFKTPPGDILRKFNEEVCYPENRTFHIYTNQFKMWRTKWDRDILEQGKAKGLDMVQQKQILQIIKTRNDEDAVVLGAPNDEDLEAGSRTLAGELLNDAITMLKDDQNLEEIYDGDVLMKRRNYIVNVFSHVTKLVHGKAALMLKASQEKRENASFLMTLLARASAGKMTDEDMGLLKTVYAKKDEQPQSA